MKQLQKLVRAFWENLESQIENGNIQNWEFYEGDAFVSNLYHVLRDVDAGLSVLLKMCHLDRTIEFLVFSTSHDQSAIDAMKALAVCGVGNEIQSAFSGWFIIQETNLKMLDEDLNNWNGYSRWWEEGSLREAEIKQLVEQSEFCFIARATLASDGYSLKDGLDEGLSKKCTVTLSHLGVSQQWWTSMDTDYIRESDG